MIHTTVFRSAASLLSIRILRLDYKAGMSLPRRPTYDWCRNPITGEYAERLFNPFALAKMLRDAGFRARVRQFFRKFPLNLTNSSRLWPLNYVLFNVRPQFIVYGEKV